MTEPKKSVTHHDASKLLHNKFVVVLGDSIQRAVYKDLVLLLQEDKYLSMAQLKNKGEMSFEQDSLVEGGRMDAMNNGTEYREVRQYRSDNHLVRFYFLTRIYSRYVESILEDFRTGIKPDVVVVNSCVWDVSRYSRQWESEYRENLHWFFEQLREVLPPDCLVVWNVTMPLGKRIMGGFLVPEIADIGPMLRYDIIEANFYAARLANAYGLDILDLHYMFRFSLHHRMKDGVHWNALAHRRITCLLLRHAAKSWGVDMPTPVINIEKIDLTEKRAYEGFARNAAPHGWHHPQSVLRAAFLGHYRDLEPRRNSAVQPSVTWSTNGTIWPQAPPTDLHWAPVAEQSAYMDDLPPAVGYFSFEELGGRQAGGSGRGAAADQRWAHGDGHRNGRGMSNHGPTAYRNIPAARSPARPANQYVMRNKNAKRNVATYNRQRPHHHNNGRQYHPYPRY